MLYPALFFLVFGLLLGIFISYQGFLSPNFVPGKYFQFGRIRPVHVNIVTILWLLAADMGLMYFFVPRLSGRPLWSEKLATFSCYLWWITTTLAIFSLPFGTNFGWEYAELPLTLARGWIPLKFLIGLAWATFALNLMMTMIQRKYEQMYVSLWYAMGTLIWTTFTFIVGNFAVLWATQGITRVNVSFFYIHNLVGLIYTPMGLAAAYYFIPKIANTPVSNHRLSMVGFWSIAFVYAWIGAHHMLHGPQSQWLQTTSIVFSIWLIIPVWTVVQNLLGTVRLNWPMYRQSVPLRFLTFGVLFYLIVCFQGSMQALRHVNEMVSKTDWIIGHSHMSLLGTFSFFAMGGIYFAIPKIVGRPLWSNKMAEWHFNLTLAGSVLMFAVLWIGGLRQGLQWASWATGNTFVEFRAHLNQLSFMHTIVGMHNWWVVRSIAGMLIFIGTCFFAVNIFNTVKK